MAVITEILGSNTLSQGRVITNQNFQNLKVSVDAFEGIFSINGGNIDLTNGTVGTLSAKKLIIPTNQGGAEIGNVTISDNDISCGKISCSTVTYTTNSIQYVQFNVNQTGATAVVIADNAYKVVLDPQSAGLSIDITQSNNNVMREINILNLSIANHDLILNVTSSFIDNSSISTITIPYLKNIKLGYINDANTTTTGWYIISHNGCVIV